jgi:cold-inducible RNA-binding protein
LSFQTTDGDLAAAFAPYGSVEKATVVRDRDSGQSRGFGFVEMSDGNEATRAINEMNGIDLDGRAINVNEARPRENRSSGPSFNRDSRGRRSNNSNRW